MITWRQKLFNWITQGRITITPEETVVSGPKKPSHTLGYLAGINGTTGIGPSAMYTQSGLSIQGGSMGADLAASRDGTTVKIINAIGGHIVCLYGSGDSYPSLYLINDNEGTDFDRELGKIITIGMLKK